MAGKEILAIFDFDGTLTEGHLWTGIAKHHKENKINRRILYYYLITHLPLWIAAKAKIYSEDKNRMKWGEDLSILFKGFKREEARNAFEWVTEKYFMPLMRSDMMEVIQRHKDQGHKIVVLSGMFTDFLEVVGKRISADFVIGTTLESKGNRYSGKIVKPLCYGNNKALLLKKYLETNKVETDLSKCFAYADSIYDKPVFDLVGNPVATYPDKELHKTAIKNNWEIIGKDQKTK